MKLKSKILLSLLATSSATFAQTAPAAPESTIAYNIGVVSQYRYRGLAQTRGTPALQGGVDYSNTNGIYLGAWASTIRWIEDSSNSSYAVDGKTELDLYAGYKFESSGLAYDLGLLRYQYIGNSLNKHADYTNANTNEIYGAVTHGAYTLKYSRAVSSSMFGYKSSQGSSYIDLTANYDLGAGFTLSPHAGHQHVNGTTATYYPAGLSYSDYSVTLTKDLGAGVSASVAAISTNAKHSISFLSNNSSYNTARDALVVGVKYTF